MEKMIDYMDEPVTHRQLQKELEPLKEESRRVKDIVTGNGTGIGLDELVRGNTKEIKAVITRLDKTDQKIDDLSKKIEPMIPFYKAGIWFASILGASVIALIWAIILGKASVIFLP